MITITTDTNGRPDNASEQKLLACLVAALRKSARFRTKLQENLLPSAWEPDGDGSVTASLELPDGTSSGHTVTALLEDGHVSAVTIEHSDGSTLEWSPSPMEEYLISNANPEADGGDADDTPLGGRPDLIVYEPGSLLDHLLGGTSFHSDAIPTSFTSLTEMESVMVEVDMALEETATDIMNERGWNSFSFSHDGKSYTAVLVGQPDMPIGVNVTDPSGHSTAHPDTDVLHDLCLALFYAE